MASAATTDSRWFGGGYIYGTQVLAPGGAAPSIIYPTQFVTIQEANVDFTLGTKELRGILEDPEDIALTTRKITGKIITGRVNLEQLNLVAFGEPGGANYFTGTKRLAKSEAHTIPTGLTVTVTNGATFYEDKGIFIAGSRLQMVPVPSAPLQGQYSYNPATGVYTFNTLDSGLNILIDYLYTSTSGHTLQGNNIVMGSGARPTFEALFQNPNDQDQELLLFYCICTGIKVPLKTEDYVKLEIDFQAYSDAFNRTFQWLSTY